MGDYGIGRLIPVSESEYSIDWKTTVLQHFYTYPEEILPTPTFGVQLRPDEVILTYDGNP